MANKWFFCERWHQQITEAVCVHRYKKGMKKCRDCKTGYELLVTRYGLGKGAMGKGQEEKNDVEDCADCPLLVKKTD